jgi:GcrA cell cycle regulator
VIWTRERIETLCALWLTTMSCREIGNELGVTRRAIIGKANRLKLTPRKAGGKHGVSRPRRKIIAVAPPEKPEPIGISLFDIRAHQCRWPLTDVVPISEFLFCGSATMESTCTYCLDHFLASTRGNVSLQSAA